MQVEYIDHIQLAMPGGEEAAAQKAHPAFRVSDLAGLHRIYVDDPFDNRLEFIETKPSA
ncbi:MAG: hypothetical protein O3A50_08190 [Planctomycetota bacterium]|nr:hypothetical protein [Planctomycetota bacterium]